MKTKLTKILGILLSTMLVVSFFSFAVPVVAADEPGNMEWATANLPDNTLHRVNSDVTDIAVGADGSRLYAVDDQGNNVFKSTNAGNSWSTLTAYPGTDATKIAVAPDDEDVIAVVDGTLNPTLHYSKDAGVTWYTLPTPPAGAVVTDIDICPARSGTLLGREYVISLADPAAATVALGDVLITDNNFNWVTVDAVNVAGQRDYVSVIASPNFLGDRAVIALGADASGAGGVIVQIINTATSAQVRATALMPTTGATTDYVTVPAGTSLITGEVAVPIDFDPTSSSGQIVFAAIASNGIPNDNEVYRVSGSSRRALGEAGNQFGSVAYSGTIEEGNLFAGYYNDNEVRRTDEPHASSPTWKGTSSPSGANMTVVRVASDFGSTDRVFAGTSGAESALSISNNGGANFWQEAFIDNTEASHSVIIDDIEITPDSEYLFIATRTAGTNVLSVFRAALPLSHEREWSRVVSKAGAGTGLLAISPDWADTPALYFANVMANGNIWVSKNGGRSFSTRNMPNATLVIGGMACENADIVYIGDSASENIYKSNNAAWTWEDPEDGNATNVRSIIVPMADHVLVGGVADASYSTNGGDSFTGKSAGLTGEGACLVAASSDYANDDTFYVGTANGNVFRWIIGESEEWKDLVDPNPNANAIVGLVELDANLYAMGAESCDRTLNPESSTNPAWDTMDAGAVLPAGFGATSFTAAPGNFCYAAGSTAANTPALWAYEDWLADYAPPVTGPPDGLELGIDPVTGRAYDVDLTFEKMGESTGLVDQLDIQISTQEAGSGGAVSFNSIGHSTSSPTIKIQAGAATGARLIGYTLNANTIYQWRARVDDQNSNDAVRSQWSPWRTISVQTGSRVTQQHAGPVLLGPMGGAQNVNPALVGFSWAPVAGATEYEVIVATDAAMTSTIGGTPAKVSAPSYEVSGLDNGTTYFWSVQATQPTVGEVSIGTFTTMMKPVEEKPAETTTLTPAPIIIPSPIAPGYMIAVIIVGAVLVIAVIVLIVRTRRIP